MQTQGGNMCAVISIWSRLFAKSSITYGLRRLFGVVTRVYSTVYSSTVYTCTFDITLQHVLPFSELNLADQITPADDAGQEARKRAPRYDNETLYLSYSTGIV